MHLQGSVHRLDLDRWPGWDHLGHGCDRLGRRPLVIGHAAVWIDEEEEKVEENLAKARQVHLYSSKEVAKALSFYWAHSPSMVEDAATAATAAAAAAAAASRCVFDAWLKRVGVFSRLDDGLEEEAKEE